MIKIAIVTGASESGIPLVKQCLVSLDSSLSTVKTEFEYSAFVYECNWHPDKDKLITEWHSRIDFTEDLPLKHIKIKQMNASNIDMKYTNLPDIAIYDDFARNYLKDFDYVLFCHNDVCFSTEPFIERAIFLVNIRNIVLIAEPTITCSEHLTIRYKPHFIFVHADKFQAANLSFANDLSLPKEFNVRPPRIDGGAGLLLSHYHQDNPTDYEATNHIPPHWLTHLRFEFTDRGIESYNIYFPNTPEFNRIIAGIEKYIDNYLYND